jgi:hypothetical protein
MLTLRFLSLPALAFIFAVGCSSSGNGTHDGAAGTGGATAGASGATAGTGGATAGASGAMAGTGGATAGTGGATAGTGGATAGTGGSAAGADGGVAGADGGSAGAGGTPADGGVDAGADAVTACNTIVNAAPAVVEMNVAGTQPVGVGGTVVAGTYFRTATEYYTGVGGAVGPTGKVRKETFVITSLGNNMITAQIVDSKTGSPEVRMNQAGTLAGATVMLTVGCPATAGVFPVTYTATAGTLTIFNTLFTPHETETYTKQP